MPSPVSPLLFSSPFLQSFKSIQFLQIPDKIPISNHLGKISSHRNLPMRIRGSSTSSPLSYSSNSTSSPTPSHSSSTISFASFQYNSSSSSIDYQTRCEGLDLLVEAVLHVAGSVLGVPFTQRRVTRRRKRAFEFSKFIFDEIVINKDEEEKGNENEAIQVISKQKKRKRGMALPSKYQDSLLQPWRRSSNRLG